MVESGGKSRAPVYGNTKVGEIGQRHVRRRGTYYYSTLIKRQLQPLPQGAAALSLSLSSRTVLSYVYYDQNLVSAPNTLTFGTTYVALKCPNIRKGGQKDCPWRCLPKSPTQAGRAELDNLVLEQTVGYDENASLTANN